MKLFNGIWEQKSPIFADFRWIEIIKIFHKLKNKNKFFDFFFFILIIFFNLLKCPTY